MAEGKTNPWIIGGIVVGAFVVFYFLYLEYQAAVANAGQTAANSTPTNDLSTSSTGLVTSAIPDQLGSASGPAQPITTPSGQISQNPVAVGPATGINAPVTEPQEPAAAATGPSVSTGDSGTPIVASPAAPVVPAAPLGAPVAKATGSGQQPSNNLAFSPWTVQL